MHLQDESAGASMNADSVSLSAEINQLTARLRDAGQHHQLQQQPDTATASYHDVSSDLIRTSLSVLKLEKQTRLQKVGVMYVSVLCN